MKITVIFQGLLANYIGEKTLRLNLPEGAVFDDLLAQIGQRFSGDMPDELWDKEQKVFKVPLLASRDQQSLDAIEPTSPLEEGDEIHLFFPISGG